MRALGVPVTEAVARLPLERRWRRPRDAADMIEPWEECATRGVIPECQIRANNWHGWPGEPVGWLLLHLQSRYSRSLALRPHMLALL